MLAKGIEAKITPMLTPKAGVANVDVTDVSAHPSIHTLCCKAEH